MWKLPAALCVLLALICIAMAKPQDADSLGKLLSDAVRQAKLERSGIERKVDTRKTDNGDDMQLLRELDNLFARSWIDLDLNNKGTETPKTELETTAPTSTTTTESTTSSTTTTTQAANRGTVLPPNNRPPKDFWKLFLTLWKSRNAFGK